MALSEDRQNTSNQHADSSVLPLLIILALAPFVVFLNVTGITAMEELIGKGLALTPSQLTTVVQAAAIASAPLILFSGHIADKYGRKRIYLAGAAVFALGSLGSGFAPDFSVMVIFRIIQGLGAGAVTALSLGLIAHQLGEHRRGLAIGVWGSGVGLGLAVGPIAGAWIAGAGGASWRYFFYLQVVLAIFLIAGASWRLAPVDNLRTSESSGIRLDLVGAILSAVAIVGLAIGVTYGGSWGWFSPTILVSLLGGILVLIAFGIYAAKVPGGILRMSAFSVTSYSITSLITVINLVVIIATFVYVGLQLQVNLHITSLKEGLLFLPFSALVLLLSPLFGRLVDRIGMRPVLIGVEVSATLGLLYLAIIVPTANGSYPVLLPGMVLIGLAAAAGAPATSTTLVATRPRSEAGEASALNGTLVQIGSGIGAGVMVAVFLSRFPAHLVAGIIGLHLDPVLTHHIISGIVTHHPYPVSPEIGGKLATVSHEAFSLSLRPIIYVLAALSVIAGALALRIKASELEFSVSE